MEVVLEKKLKAAKVRGKVQAKKETSGDVNQKAKGKQSGSGQLSVAKGNGKAAKLKNVGGQSRLGQLSVAKGNGKAAKSVGGQRVDPENYCEALTGNMEEAVAKFFERAVSHEMMQAEL
ncbi:hypothetical protein EST38_g13627 [Candolleomyces aberdarensis]|uniref:Uncharacterized protein n=1 Tax=Candolleomyces aberdarensis TaxID=2316362 RepID=A0A4Q2CZG6_9AGAR|nr:hypothetical protein EST38_g13627 [Candolleomyces aberdarensis]